MNLSEQYLQDLLVRQTYHSVAIAGYKISPESVIAILLDQQIPSQVDTETYTIVDNHRYTMECIVRNAINHEQLTFPLLFELHHRLMKGIDPTAGHFKTMHNKIPGNHFIPASPKDTPILMKQITDNMNQKIADGIEQNDLIALIAQFVIVLEHIQAFQTGNGMFTRLVINFILLKEDIAPWIVMEKDALLYHNLIHTQNTEKLTHFAEQLIQAEEKRMRSY